MLDVKSPLILGAPPAGLALACAVWLLFAAAGPAAKPLEEAEARLEQLPVSRRPAANPPTTAGRIAGADLFGAMAPPPPVRLDGISKTRRRAAALLAFGEGPAQWVRLGSTIDGVTLVEVSDAEVWLETVSGRQALGLGDSTAAAASPGAVDAN